MLRDSAVRRSGSRVTNPRMRFQRDLKFFKLGRRRRRLWPQVVQRKTEVWRQERAAHACQLMHRCRCNHTNQDGVAYSSPLAPISRIARVIHHAPTFFDCFNRPRRGSLKPDRQRRGNEHSRSRSAAMQTRSIWRRHVMLMHRHGPFHLGFQILTEDVSLMLSLL